MLKCSNYMMSLLNRVIMLSFLCFAYSFAQIDKETEKQICLTIAEHDSIFLQTWDLTMASNLSKNRNCKSFLENIKYVRKLITPFKRSSFNVFCSSNFEPASFYTFCLFDTEFCEVPHDTSYPSQSLTNFINQRFVYEKSFDNQELLDFVAVFNDLTDPGYGFNRLLNSWKDIELKSKETISKKIKKAIKPPRISQQGLLRIVTSYVWNMGSTELREVIFKYQDRRLNLQSRTIAHVGEYHLIL
jgi:hypothetical protein